MPSAKIPVAAKVDRETADKIDRAADEVDMTTSRFVANILEAYVKQNPHDIEALYPEDPLSSFDAFGRAYL